ncbi:NUDIX hydrolase [Magnetofaba australis]|nr:NUDIX domain-containing protein [Magnetofaba australis]
MDEAAFLEQYDITAYRAPIATVDMAIFTVLEEQLQVLLYRRGEHPHKDRWALPGGIIDVGVDVDLEAAARRKLHGKTGVASPYLEQVATVGNGGRDPRGWSLSVLYFALLPAEGVTLSHGWGAAQAQWRPVTEDGVDMPLAFDHTELLTAAVQRLRGKVAYTALPAHLLGEEFTLSELQRVYEILLGRKIEKSAFRKRILDAGVVESAAGRKRTGANRPAQLYRRRQSASSHLFPRNLATGDL